LDRQVEERQPHGLDPGADVNRPTVAVVGGLVVDRPDRPHLVRSVPVRSADAPDLAGAGIGQQLDADQCRNGGRQVGRRLLDRCVGDRPDRFGLANARSTGAQACDRGRPVPGG
jgi:hypothetical protein